LDKSFQKGSGADTVASALSSLIWANSSIQNLSLCGGFEQVVIPLLNSLHKNSSLSVLDISDNKVGDAGASCVADFIRANTHLNTLKIEDTDIGYNGWLSIRWALGYNTTLQHLTLPELSTMRGLSNDKFEKLRKIFYEINVMLAVNAGADLKKPGFPPSNTPKSVYSQLAEIPDRLRETTISEAQSFVATEELVNNNATTESSTEEANPPESTQQETINTSDDGLKEKEKETDKQWDESSSSSEEGYLYEEVTI